MKNILINSNGTIEHEIMRRGIENLLRLKLPKGKYNFIRRRSPHVDAIVITGGSHWKVDDIEPIYNISEINDIPLLVLGASDETTSELVPIQKYVWQNPNNEITFRSIESMEDFKEQTSNVKKVLTCPSAFAVDVMGKKKAKRGIGYVIGNLKDRDSYDKLLQKFSENGGTILAYEANNFDYWTMKGLTPTWLDGVDQVLDTVSGLETLYTDSVNLAIAAHYTGVDVQFIGNGNEAKTVLTMMQNYDILGPGYIKVIEDWINRNAL